MAGTIEDFIPSTSQLIQLWGVTDQHIDPIVIYKCKTNEDQLVFYKYEETTGKFYEITETAYNEAKTLGQKNNKDLGKLIRKENEDYYNAQLAMEDLPESSGTFEMFAKYRGTALNNDIWDDTSSTEDVTDFWHIDNCNMLDKIIEKQDNTDSVQDFVLDQKDTPFLETAFLEIGGFKLEPEQPIRKSKNKIRRKTLCKRRATAK